MPAFYSHYSCLLLTTWCLSNGWRVFFSIVFLIITKFKKIHKYLAIFLQSRFVSWFPFLRNSVALELDSTKTTLIVLTGHFYTILMDKSLQSAKPICTEGPHLPYRKLCSCWCIFVYSFSGNTIPVF